MDVTIEVDEEKNIVYMKHVGSYSSVEEAEQEGQRLLDMVKDLDSWCSINDITEMAPVSPDVSSKLSEHQEKLDEHGADAVVRVVKDANKVSQMSFKIGGDYNFDEYEAESVEEAEEIIETHREQTE